MPSLVEQTPTYLLLLFGAAVIVFIGVVAWLRSLRRDGDDTSTALKIGATAFVVLLFCGAFIERGYVRTLRGANAITLAALERVDVGDSIPMPQGLFGEDTDIPTLTIEGLELTFFSRRVSYEFVEEEHSPRDVRRFRWVGRPADGHTQEEALEDIIAQLEVIIEQLAQRGTTTTRGLNDGAVVVKPASEPDDNPYWITASVAPLDDGNIRVGTHVVVGPDGLFGADSVELLPPQLAQFSSIVSPLIELEGARLFEWYVDGGPDGATLDGATFRFEERRRPSPPMQCDDAIEATGSVRDAIRIYDPTVVEQEPEEGVRRPSITFQGDQSRFSFGYDCDGREVRMFDQAFVLFAETDGLS